MNKVLLILTILIAQESLATDIEYHGRVNYAEYFSKTVRHSWCIFSDGDSKVDTGEISQSARGDNQTVYDIYSHRGENYLRRKIEWKNEETDRNLRITFTAESAKFEGEQEYDKKTCSYKTWKGQSTSAESRFRARAAFIIPKDVWAIRIISDQETKAGELSIALSNLDYRKNENGETKLVPVTFYSFNKDQTDQYFQVNPSHDQDQNFVYFDMAYQSRTLQENNFKLNFRVEFIAEEKCLMDLSKLHFKEVLERQMSQNRYEDTLTNLSCMLNANFVKHTLAQLRLNGLGELFQKLRDMERNLSQQDISSTSARDRQMHALVLQLNDRVKFYYSYEILKEAMSLLTKEIEYDGKRMDAWMYLELLRRRGVLYLVEVLSNLDKTLAQLSSDSHLPIIELPREESLKVDILLNSILPIEFKGFQRASALIYRPTYLALNTFIDLQSSADEVIIRSKEFLESNKPLLESGKITVAQADRIRKETRGLITGLRQYAVEIERFRFLKEDNSPEGWAKSRRELVNEMEKIFQLNFMALTEDVGEYYKKHFEDQSLKDITINNKRYSDIQEFIKDFQQMLEESRI